MHCCQFHLHFRSSFYANILSQKNYNENSDITFKDSIKKHLQPWYVKKNKDDYIKKLSQVKKLFSKGYENENSDLELNEENEYEEDKNKSFRNYDDVYERLEFDINNRISVKDKFKNKNIIKNNQIFIDSDDLEFLKGEKNLMNFLQEKKKEGGLMEKKNIQKITIDDLYLQIKEKNELNIKKKKKKSKKKHKKKDKI